MAKSIIIIGGGVAGLAAGCYAQMNGYKSQIFEMHILPGGLCTAWERKDYIFDGCIHYLFGSAPHQPFHQLWQELGAVQGRTMIDHEEYIRVVAGDGQTLIVYTDPDRLERHMKELSPADSRLIEDLAQGVRQFTHFDMSLLQTKARSLMGVWDWAKLGMTMMPFAKPLAKWGLVSAAQLAARFKDPFLRRAVPQMFSWPDIPMMAGISLLAYMHTKNAGFPAGGSLDFVRAIERRYLELGGEIFYQSEVERILVEDKRAVGVRLYDDRTYRADIVVSAADGRGTIFDLLDGRFADGGLKRRYDGHLPVHAQVQISLGVKRDLARDPHWVTYLLDKPLLVAGDERYEIGVKNYCFDPSLAPPGKSVIEVIFTTHYDWWQRIYGHPLYDSEQHQVSGIVIDWLESVYPGIRQDIEVVDEATPLSYERYTGNWQGSACGFLLTTETMPMMLMGVSKTLPGLRNFYMTGQWVEPGGTVPISAMSGRNVIQMICYEDMKPFVATSP